LPLQKLQSKLFPALVTAVKLNEEFDGMNQNHTRNWETCETLLEGHFFSSFGLFSPRKPKTKADHFDISLARKVFAASTQKKADTL